jgi:hypothetical protein
MNIQGNAPDSRGSSRVKSPDVLSAGSNIKSFINGPLREGSNMDVH